jgi:hypothetical protein
MYFVLQETERNGEVSKIELWDRAHKRKEDNDSNNVNTIMVQLYLLHVFREQK